MRPAAGKGESENASVTKRRVNPAAIKKTAFQIGPKEPVNKRGGKV